MQTLSYGYKKPQTGDKGSIYFPALEDDIQRLNDHTHNGTDSAKLTAASITTVQGSISAASWGAVSGKTGLFFQEVSMPIGFTYDTYALSFRDTAGDSLFLQTEKTGSGTYNVYCNDSALDVVVLYGS